MKKFKPDWFLLGMFAAAGLAAFAPDAGARGGWLHAEWLNKIGVALIFFLHGAGLSFAALRNGMLNFRLHVLVQCVTFLVFPVLGAVLVTVFKPWIQPDLSLGLFFLCALPSTVSSSVAMTAAARGNVPGAVFNATVSSLIGVVLTPLWTGWMVANAGHALPIGKVMLDLVIWLVCPLSLGQLARPWIADFIKRHKSKVHVVDRGTILLLVYTSFCDSVKWGVWSGNGLGHVAIAAVFSLAVFSFVLWATGVAARRFQFSREDEITAVFCGSKKTLASGIPMAQLMFAGNPGLSLILLPIMIYHPLQLMICGVLAARWARRGDIPGDGSFEKVT